MRIKEIELREIQMRRKTPFTSSRGTFQNRRIIIIIVRDFDGNEGFGECTAGEEPRYCEEWTDSAWYFLESLLIPLILLNSEIEASNINQTMLKYRGNRMAKAAVEMAIWDLKAKILKLPLWKLLGGVPDPIPCGVALGISSSIQELLKKINLELESGYKRIKLKIEPSSSINIIKQVRKNFPTIPLMVDANGSFCLNDIDLLKQLDEYDLLMIEQPFMPEDLVTHKIASEIISTKLCLDETIISLEAANMVAEFVKCPIFNLKLGRMGGHCESSMVASLCNSWGIESWCGGQHETGLGKAHNIALASQLVRKIPAELSSSSRYWEKDIILPEIEVGSDGNLILRDDIGIGYEIDIEFIESITVRKKTLNNLNFQNKNTY
ncbi:MAG: o-succinylbenzoate synthase [Flavobacteriales bacterium]